MNTKAEAVDTGPVWRINHGITHHPVFQIIRNLRKIDRTQFRADVAATLTNRPPTSADDFNSTLRAVLDNHARATRREVI